MAQAADRAEWTLLSDDGLRLAVDAALCPLMQRWLPRSARGTRDVTPLGGGGSILLLGREGESPSAPFPTKEATLRLGSVRAWIDERAGRATLHAENGQCGGTLDLAAGVAELRATPTPHPTPEQELCVFTLLTISAALLLSRSERALTHAAAVLAPGGGAWLLVGDARSGKTTTTVNLVREGCGYLSDDHVVLCPVGAEGVQVEGWPRTFHLDAGWQRGEVEGTRVDFDPDRLGPGRWVSSAPLAGILFPRVSPDAPTAIRPLTPAAALVRLIRQSPWFVADRPATPRVLGLLEHVVHRPAFELDLGLDSYRGPALLRTRLGPLFGV